MSARPPPTVTVELIIDGLTYLITGYVDSIGDLRITRAEIPEISIELSEKFMKGLSDSEKSRLYAALEAKLAQEIP